MAGRADYSDFRRTKPAPTLGFFWDNDQDRATRDQTDYYLDAKGSTSISSIRSKRTVTRRFFARPEAFPFDATG